MWGQGDLQKIYMVNGATATDYIWLLNKYLLPTEADGQKEATPRHVHVPFCLSFTFNILARYVHACIIYIRIAVRVVAMHAKDS